MTVVTLPKRDRSRPAMRSVKNRSRVSNGRELLPGIDGRSAMARRFYDLTTQIAVDQGGHDQISETRLQLIRRFAAASVLAEQLEARLANGEKIDSSEHALLVSSCVRLARQLGVNRVAKNVTPSLGEYLRDRPQARPRVIEHSSHDGEDDA